MPRWSCCGSSRRGPAAASRTQRTEAAQKRLEDWRRRRTGLVGRRLAELDEADRAALRAALPALRKPAVTLHGEAEDQ
ncbi:hypothetical protein Scel_83660 [Streptomyces cellostaticus]|nr:hypothetical protein Scel_83660 [Streptomyces cellostaticus]